MYPDQSLYPVDSVPKMVERINNAFIRTDEIHALNGDFSTDWFPPIIADAEAGFGGNLNAFELMKAMVEAGRCDFEVIELYGAEYEIAVRDGLLQTIDYSVVDPDNIIPDFAKHDNGYLFVTFSELIPSRSSRLDIT